MARFERRHEQDRASRPIVTMIVRMVGRLTTVSFVMRTLVLGVLTMIISTAAHALPLTLG